ncbi:HlyD family type I secretion periplasmic adaptor subunit [Pelagicoccus sp. SDUM812002]|uniref:HlyD family type I secretion periplasmic adaptor subunit n=1 Tax=Pelagicoccus sp. SDUM812002 TaxID=3041266 RepID=UPI00280D1D20|nr:HlyD family type I secretion periplasmic adaptor subunit [Pelagicoccus sp. SDUM812002]MDQ8185353.1 HlyD family type I secretion periplasmic adaptor subunit [Pelagicoccus sp. SDUM812002]
MNTPEPSRFQSGKKTVPEKTQTPINEETVSPKADSEVQATEPKEPVETKVDPPQASPLKSEQETVKPKKSDLDFVADTKAAFLENRSPLASLLLFTIVGVISTFVYWASSSEVNEITRGQGKVVPTDFLQVVQILEGGILSELNVRAGDIVNKGDSLLRIDSTAFSAARSESAAQRDSLMARIARLEAEANDSDSITFPEYILQSRPDLAISERTLFESRRSNLAGSVRHLSKSLELKRQELDITVPLAEKGIVSQVELLRLQSAVNDTESELSRIQTDYTKEVLTLRNEVQAKMEQIQQSMLAYEDKIRRTDVKSPVTGTINKVNFNTIGGVIRSGEPIVEIVPHESDLIVEASVLPKDIGFIHPGQEATVKLSAYDFSIYGGLRGTVEHISADTFTDERGDSYYTIRVRTGERSLATTDQDFNIIPGMQVEVDILTGKKTVLDYIFKPLLRAKMNALTER